MDPDPAGEKLSQIQTMWTAIRQTREGSTGPGSAQVRLLERYTPAIQRFLRRALRDPDAAEEVFQVFVERFLRGGYGGADPGRGRFRDFLATVLRNLVFDHKRATKRRPQSLDALGPEMEDHAAMEALQRAFQADWRQELLAHTWEALAQHDRQTGQRLHLVLRFQTDHLELKSAQVAQALGARMGKTVSPAWVRKWWLRARERFLDLFLDEIARSLRDARPEALEQELAELGLLKECRDAVERRRESILGG